MRNRLLLTSLLALCGNLCGADFPVRIKATRLPGNPIIREDMLPGDDGTSINGPSLIRVPAWVKNPLGKYYLYFAHHKGKYIRLAYADRIEGPWKIYPGGVMPMDDQTALKGHVASPDAIVDADGKRIVLYFHGQPASLVAKKMPPGERDPEAGQKSSYAVSGDGLHFRAGNIQVGPAYLRIFPFEHAWYAINAQLLLRAQHLGEPFQPVASIIGSEIAGQVDPVKLGEPGAVADRPDHGADRYSIRHVGIDIFDGHLLVYFSCVGHRPERILCTFIDMKGDPAKWKAKGVMEILRPEAQWEGGSLPLAYSKGGVSTHLERGLRDPAIFVDQGKRYLVYSAGGEHAMAIASLDYEAVR